LAHAFSSADYRYLILAAIPFAVILCVKVSRWGLLFGPGAPSWSTLFGAISVGYGVNTIVPFRIGEAVTAYWVRDRAGVSMVRTLGTVAVERITDGVSVLLILVIFAPTVSFPAAWVGPTVLVGAVLVAALGLLIVIAAVPRQERAWLQHIARRLHQSPARLLVEPVGHAFAGVRALRNPSALALYVGYTAVIWVGNSILFWLLVRAFHLNVPLSAGFLLTGVLFLGMAVPSSPGYLGVFDYLMVITLSLYHVARGPAVAAALAAHVINFVPVTVVGLLLLAHHGAGRAFGLLVASQRTEQS
jgi:uncharacterized protein (TIRG00374 family)